MDNNGNFNKITVILEFIKSNIKIINDYKEHLKILLSNNIIYQNKYNYIMDKLKFLSIESNNNLKSLNIIEKIINLSDDIIDFDLINNKILDIELNTDIIKKELHKIIYDYGFISISSILNILENNIYNKNQINLEKKIFIIDNFFQVIKVEKKYKSFENDIYIRIKNIEKNIEHKNNIGNNELYKIDDNDLYNFMFNSLFEIQDNLENDLISEKIINKDTNLKILNYINYKNINLSIDEFKKILDEYIDNKINRIKPVITETIKYISYNLNGLADLKYSFDYKSFPIYEEISKDYEIKINYISGSIYSIIIEQKNFDLFGTIQINDVLDLIKIEIEKRALERNILKL